MRGFSNSAKQYIYGAIAFIIAVLLAYALLALARDDASGQVQDQIIILLPPSKWDDKLDELDRKALDEAYVAKIKQLFDVWVREGLTSSEGPAKGHAQARRAYIAAHDAMEKKEELRKQRDQK